MTRLSTYTMFLALAVCAAGCGREGLPRFHCNGVDDDSAALEAAIKGKNFIAANGRVMRANPQAIDVVDICRGRSGEIYLGNVYEVPPHVPTPNPKRLPECRANSAGPCIGHGPPKN